MNSVSDEVLEALFRYGFRLITCSIDGATQKTYQPCRVNGSLAKVLGDIRKLNRIEEQYESALCALRWQFEVFGHNEHEIDRAGEPAEEPGMEFTLKLSWDSEFSPVRDQAMVGRELGAASGQEYSRLFGPEVCAFGVFDSRLFGRSGGRVFGAACVPGPIQAGRQGSVSRDHTRPGAGYEAHVDRPGVAIVVLEGEVGTLGRRVVPHGVVLLAARLAAGRVRDVSSARRSPSDISRSQEAGGPALIIRPTQSPPDARAAVHVFRYNPRSFLT
jgi:hypothetical protein